MSDFNHHASVHPRTVTSVSRREPAKPTRKFYGRTEHATFGTSIIVDPRVWTVALQACGGEPRRIEVIDECHVEIHNDPDWRRH